MAIYDNTSNMWVPTGSVASATWRWNQNKGPMWTRALETCGFTHHFNYCRNFSPVSERQSHSWEGQEDETKTAEHTLSLCSCCTCGWNKDEAKLPRNVGVTEKQILGNYVCLGLKGQRSLCHWLLQSAVWCIHRLKRQVWFYLKCSGLYSLFDWKCQN